MTMEENKEQNGKPWKIIFKSRSFQEADLYRKNYISENPGVAVKVKYLSSSDCFVVKTRKSEKNKKNN